MWIVIADRVGQVDEAGWGQSLRVDLSIVVIGIVVAVVVVTFLSGRRG